MEIDRPDLRRQGTFPLRPGTAPAPPGGRLAALGEKASDLVWELNESLVFIYASASFRRVLHYKPAALLGCGAPAFLHPGDAAAVSAEFAGLILGAPSARLLFRIRDGEGRWRWLDCSGKAYRGCDGEARAVFISRDVTRCRNARRRNGNGCAPAAAATALQSQEYFAEQLVQAAGRVRSAVVSLRLDNFRQLHPRSGRPAEERFRMALANLLCEAIPAGGLAAHGGGDEFVLLLYGMTGLEASGVAEEIRSRLAGYRFIDGGATHAVSVSLGVAEVGVGNARDALGRARAAGAAARASGNR